MADPSSVERRVFEEEKAMLELAVGIPGSGAARYSAAMYFHKLGKLSLEMLEIYRRCAKFDNEDPIALAQLEGVEVTARQKLEAGN